MYNIGPFLVKTELLEQRVPGNYYWFYIEINDENTVLKFFAAPFLLSDTRLPKTFQAYHAKSDIFSVFDPSSESYFVLAITIEHRLIKFRPLNAPLNFKPHLGELFSYGGYRPEFPARQAIPHTMDTCEAMYNELQNNQELMSCIKLQYQTSIKSSFWNIEKQDINGVNFISKNTKEALTKNGFLLALNSLKTESKTPLTYCYAIASIITKKSISFALQKKLSEELSLIEEAEQLTRYMMDTTLYDTTHPLNEELFEEIKRLYISEIDKYKKLESGDDVLLALNDEDFLSFTEISNDFNAKHSRNHTNIHYSEDTYFQMLTNQASIPGKIKNLQACLFDLKNNKILLADLKERFDVHFDDDDFETKLEQLIKSINKRYKELLKCSVKLYIDRGLDNVQLCEKLKPIVRESSDARILLNMLNQHEQKCALIDALEIQNPDCEFMQTQNDFFNLAIDLKNDALHFLFMKRTPEEWSKLITKFDDLLLFLKIIKTNEKKLLLINGNLTYFASLINTDYKLLQLLPICNIKQLNILLDQITPSTTQHWFQTPKKLEALLTLEVSSYLMAKVSLVLSHIPISRRITVIIQIYRDSTYMVAKFLTGTRINLLKLYWESLDEADWALLFRNFNQLMGLLFTLMRGDVSGHIVLEEFIEKIPQQFKQQILERINLAPEEYYNKKLLDILQNSSTARSQLHGLGLFRGNQTPPEIERPLKCARLSY